MVNRPLSSILVDMTPHEVCTGKNPSLAHLRVFCRDDFVHVPEEKMSKLDNKVVKCIFIDYTYGVKGYKLWDLIMRKIIYSQDVIFREVESTSKHEGVLRENKLEKLEFELKNDVSDLDESIESDEVVKSQTLVVRRFD